MDETADNKIEWLNKTFVQEWKEIKQIIQTLDVNSLDSSFIKLNKILSKYQEQPQLLDNHLAEIIERLTTLIIRYYHEFMNTNDMNDKKAFIMKCFSLLYTLSNIRGYKNILKYFPHEVGRVEQIFKYLLYFSNRNNVEDINNYFENIKMQSGMENFSTVTSTSATGKVHHFASHHSYIPCLWHAEYIASLWLSVAILAPFNLSLLISKTEIEEEKPISTKIREWCEAVPTRLENCDSPTLISTSLLLSKLLLRPDLEFEVDNFLNWSLKNLQICQEDKDLSSHAANTRIICSLTILSFVLKLNSRKVLLKFDSTLRSLIDVTAPLTTRDVFQRKLSLKVIGRIMLCYLTPKIRRPSLIPSSLLHNLELSAPTFIENSQNTSNYDMNEKRGTEDDDEDEDEDDLTEDIEEMVERVLKLVIKGLGDSDSKVRWGCAKRVATIAERLSTSFANQIIDFVIMLFNPLLEDQYWHGGCLALAEIGRRGGIKVNRLADVMEKVILACYYDQRVGNSCKGANVRDAACYVIWAFARSFLPHEIKDYAQQMISVMVIISVFDREVNCRRAASAALQELVGRLSSIAPQLSALPPSSSPTTWEEIPLEDIIGLADYYGVGNRRDAYINIAPQIAKSNLFFFPMMKYLLDHKIYHWDKVLSNLAAEAMGKLTLISPTDVLSVALPQIIVMTKSKNIEPRCGAIMTLSEILISLHVLSATSHLSNEMINEILSIVPIAVNEPKILRRHRNNLFLPSLCHLIHSISIAKLPINDDNDNQIGKEKILKAFETILMDSVCSGNENVQLCGLNSFRAFSEHFHHYYSVDQLKAMIIDYIQHMEKDSNVEIRRGYTLAIGALSSHTLDLHLRPTITSLIQTTKIPVKKSLKDVEVRRNAVESLLEVVHKINVFEKLDRTSIHDIVRAFLKGLEDYSVDNRGDVGSWIREPCIKALAQIAYLLCKYDYHHVDHNENYTEEEKKNKELFTERMCNLIISGILKQAVERIDRIRDIASHSLLFLLHCMESEFLSSPKLYYSLLIRPLHLYDITNLSLSHPTRHSSHSQTQLMGFTEPITIKYIANRNELSETLYDPSPRMTWATAKCTFPIFTSLLRFREYHLPLLSGLILSVGGKTKDISLNSSQSLVDFISKHRNVTTIVKKDGGDRKETLEEQIMTTFEVIGRKAKGNDALFLSYLKTLNVLFTNQFFLKYQPPVSSFSTNIQQLLDDVNNNDYPLLIESISILIHLLLFNNPTRSLSLNSIIKYLVHPFPQVRQYASENLYLYITTFDHLFDNAGAALSLLQSINWLETHPEDLRSCQEKLSAFLNL